MVGEMAEVVMDKEELAGMESGEVGKEDWWTGACQTASVIRGFHVVEQARGSAVAKDMCCYSARGRHTCSRRFAAVLYVHQNDENDDHEGHAEQGLYSTAEDLRVRLVEGKRAVVRYGSVA